MYSSEVIELMNLVLAREQNIDVQVQFWLTTTFATIVAAFAGREHLSQKLRHIVATLYLLATLTFVSRWYYDAVAILSYASQISELVKGASPPIVTIVSRVLLITCGTLGTIYFIYFSANGTVVEASADET